MAEEAKSKQGFAAMSKEKQEEARRKSVETRAAKRLKKEKQLAEANKLRKKAEDLQKQVEMLLQQADELDGQCSSSKIKKKREAELCEKIDELYRDTVSSQYLSIMKKYAILRGVSAESLVTPTFVAMDILHNSNSTPKELDNAVKTLQQYENAKPAVVTDDGGEVIGSAQEVFDGLMNKVAESAPKR